MPSDTYHFDEYGRMTNPPDGSYVATSSGTGMRIDYTYDANGMRKTKTVTTGTLVSTPRNGLHWDEDGVLRYYENGYRMRAGLIWVDGHYYYIKSDGTAVRNQTYWVSHNNTNEYPKANAGGPSPTGKFFTCCSAAIVSSKYESHSRAWHYT